MVPEVSLAGMVAGRGAGAWAGSGSVANVTLLDPAAWDCGPTAARYDNGVRGATASTDVEAGRCDGAVVSRTGVWRAGWTSPGLSRVVCISKATLEAGSWTMACAVAGMVEREAR